MLSETETLTYAQNTDSREHALQIDELWPYLADIIELWKAAGHELSHSHIFGYIGSSHEYG